MIFPQKHISFYESILGLSSYILFKIKTKPHSIDALWGTFCRSENTIKFPAKHSFDNLILAIDMLFALNKIKITDKGLLTYENT